MSLRDVTRSIINRVETASGLDTNDPTQKYQLNTLPGNFSGLNLVCLMYVAFKSIAPEMDIGFDLAKEYAVKPNRDQIIARPRTLNTPRRVPLGGAYDSDPRRHGVRL